MTFALVCDVVNRAINGNEISFNSRSFHVDGTAIGRLDAEEFMITVQRDSIFHVFPLGDGVTFTLPDDLPVLPWTGRAGRCRK